MRLREWKPPGVDHQAGATADLDRFFALDQVCFHPGVAYTRAELRAFAEHPSAFSVLAEELRDGSAELLGFSIGRTMRVHGRPAFHIITIDVAPAARRLGVGSALMGWMVAKAAELRAEGVRLEVAVDNEDALRFYERLGFKPVGRIPGYYLGKTDALVLELALRKRRGTWLP